MILRLKTDALNHICEEYCLKVGAINIEYETIEFENGNIQNQSGELDKKVGNFTVKFCYNWFCVSKFD